VKTYDPVVKKMQIMKKLVNYYAAIFLPLLGICLIAGNGLMSSLAFTILILFYAFIYHPLVSGIRLYQIGAIRKSQIIMNFIPGWNLSYHLLLFFNNG